MPFFKRRLPLGRQPRDIEQEGTYNSDRGVVFVRKRKDKPYYPDWTPVGAETRSRGVVGRYFEVPESVDFVGKSAEKYE